MAQLELLTGSHRRATTNHSHVWMHVVVAKARFTRAQRRRSDVIHFEVRMRGANDIADAAKRLGGASVHCVSKDGPLESIGAIHKPHVVSC